MGDGVQAVARGCSGAYNGLLTDPEYWSKRAVPGQIRVDPANNGKQAYVPDQKNPAAGNEPCRGGGQRVLLSTNTSLNRRCA